MKTIKKTMSIILSLLCAFALVSTSACTDKVVDTEDYPVPDVVNTDTDKDTDADESDKPKEDNEETEEIDEALRDEPDTLREKGKYQYNPTTLHKISRDQIKANPKIARAAKKIMQAVYDVENNVEFEEDKCSEAELKLAVQLAQFSSPLVGTASFDYDSETESINIVYFPDVTYDEFNDPIIGNGLSEDETREKFEKFEAYITDTINNNLTDQNTDGERAQIIFKAIVQDLNLHYYDGEENTALEEQIMERSEGSTEVDNTLVDQVINGEVEFWEMAELYQFFLTQLNIDSIIMGASGQYQQQSLSKLDTEMSGTGGWMWNLVTFEDKTYHCDILFEKMALDTQRESFDEYEPDLKYFGMSDKTREESFKMYYKVSLETLNPTNSPEIPVCEEDYKK